MRTHASFRAFVALTATVTVWGAASATSLAEPSAGDSKIAFIRDGDLYVMNADGSAAKRLAPDTGLSLHFAWSEDGSRLAFVQQYDDPKPPYRHYPGDIYVMQSDGRDVRRITRRRAVNAEEITWSPDGRWLGYARSVETCNFCGEWPLEAIAVNSLSGNERRIAPKVSSSLAPQWSPTAPSIAFIGQRRGSPISLYITREDGARLHRLTNADAVRPSWSPDGRTLLYLRDDSIRRVVS